MWRKSWMSCGPTVLCSVYTGLPHWFFWHTSSRTFDQVNKFTLITIQLTKFSLSNYVQLIQSVKASHNGKYIDVWSFFCNQPVALLSLFFFPLNNEGDIYKKWQCEASHLSWWFQGMWLQCHGVSGCQLHSRHQIKHTFLHSKSPIFKVETQTLTHGTYVIYGCVLIGPRKIQLQCKNLFDTYWFLILEWCCLQILLLSFSKNIIKQISTGKDEDHFLKMFICKFVQLRQDFLNPQFWHSPFKLTKEK